MPLGSKHSFHTLTIAKEASFVLAQRAKNSFAKGRNVKSFSQRKYEYLNFDGSTDT